MKLFSTRKPRSYRRVSIYTDESRDRLQKLVDDVKREQGEAPAHDEPYNPSTSPRAPRSTRRATRSWAGL